MGDTRFNQIKDPLFWEKAWHEDRESSLFRQGRKTLQDTIDFWNKRAGSFQKNVMGQKGDKRVKRVLHWLEMQGVDLAGKRVLDIGAGPGAFSLALAQHCREVVALEPAEAMVEFLQSEITRQGYNNVRVIQNTWEEVDIRQEGLLDQFDLVFASMSPGINSLDTINKALDCSKEYFYYSSFAGQRESDLLKSLWPALYGESLPPWPGQVIYVLNLLYTLKLELNFEVWEERSRAELTLPEAVDSLMDELRMYGKESSKEGEELRALLEPSIRDGVLIQEKTTRLGQILARKA